ncbi:MAG: hypothetical protein PHE68_05965 [Candidatus Peribacteraceae bacterium]|nr:hypothetical protein [Candidatus Peribacteraceae bacterium]MDD5074246.1 hypothetical protein [Candidatus Peribacteraceae bacterium]
MADIESPKLTAPEKEKPKTTFEQARLVLTRTNEENVPPASEKQKNEKSSLEEKTRIGLLTTTWGLPPSDKKDRMLKIAWDKVIKKGDTPAFLAERTVQASFKLNDYMRQLQDENPETEIGKERLSFKRDDVRKKTRDHDVNILREIDGMFLNCQQDGLVTVEGNKLCNRVGYAAQRIERLDAMLKQGDITADQKKYIGRVRGFFQAVMDGDRNWTKVREGLHQKREWSPAMKEARGAARMLAFLAASALALVATLMDMKNKKLSPYTIAWIGIAAGIAGAFEGTGKATERQMKFFTSSDWESLNLNGKESGRAIEMIYNAHKRKGKNDRELSDKFQKQLREKKITGKSVSPQEYIRWVVGENPAAEDKAAEVKLTEIASTGKFDYFIRSVLSVSDAPARSVFLDLVTHNSNSRSVSAELAGASAPKTDRAEAPQK